MKKTHPTQKINSRSGISLIETVIAVLILGIIGAALMGLLLQITSVSNSSKFKSEATNYAQEAIEQAKDVKNQGWANLGAVGVKCYSDGTLSTIAADCIKGSPIGSTQFSRYVKVTVAATQAQVQSVVTWTEKAAPKKVEIDTYFYQY